MLSEQMYDDIKQNLLYIKIAYNPSTLNQQNWIELYEDIQINEKLLLFSDHFEDTKGYGYRCAVFVDQMAKKITFANSGTRFNYGIIAAFYDLWDDLNVICGFLPYKVKFAQKLNQVILENMAQDLENYELVYTGHSLGSVIADLQAFDMEIKLSKNAIKPRAISSITFENPGTELFHYQLYKDVDISASSIKHLIINNRPNIINTYRPQAWPVWQMRHHLSAKLSNYELGIAKIANLIKGALNGFAPKFIKHIFDSFKYGSLARQFWEHHIDRFIEVLSTKKDLDWQLSLESGSFLQECFDMKNIAFEDNKLMQEVNFDTLFYA